MQDQRQKTLDRLDTLFGDNWKSAYARALDIDVATVRRMHGTTLKHATALLEFLEITRPKHWPARFSEMAQMHVNHMRETT